MRRCSFIRKYTFLAPTLAALVVTVFSVAAALPAAACGGLVAPDGAVRLERAATLVAWHDGVEHYMTAFTYQGEVSSLGWIVPLPTVPDKIQEGGAWTLQRLARETHPQPAVFGDVRSAAASDSAQVLQQLTIEALNITVLKGSGQEMLNWCATNNFTLNAETRAHLLHYAAGSPYFMAAKFDTSIIKARHEVQGDGTPILITMHTAHPWVPLEVLALDGQQVQADIYLLTDEPLNTSDVGAVAGQSPVGTEIPGAPGFQLAFQEPMNASLYHDLSTDRNMSWVRPDGWLTYLSLDAPSEEVTYDMGVTSRSVIRIAPFGTAPMAIGGGIPNHALPSWLPSLPIGTPEVALAITLLIGFMVLLYIIYRPKSPRTKKQAHASL
jgi:Uncharacterized protein conserved in bacteria (DUF2330)